MPVQSKPIKIKKNTLPTLRLFLPSIPAGFPSPADDYLEKPLDLNKALVKHPAATYSFKVVGDSMVGVGIHSGDTLIVDRALRPKPNDIVIAAINGEWTVKRLNLEGKTPRLIAENPNYKTITVSELSDLRIFGVVKHVIHSF